MGGLLLIVFVNFVGIGALIPVLPYAVIDEAGGSETIMALLMASFAFAMFVGAPILGYLSDRLGRKRVLVLSTLVSALGHLVFALTTDLDGDVCCSHYRRISGWQYRRHSSHHYRQHQRRHPRQLDGTTGGIHWPWFCGRTSLGRLLSGIGGAVHTAPFLLAAILAGVGFVLALINVKETASISPSARLPFAERWQGFRAAGLTGFASCCIFAQSSLCPSRGIFCLGAER